MDINKHGNFTLKHKLK